ncbi:reverse transcriptase [Phytophthora megakarya]|uniref:Reverse transcriptase n=1 Tax=Phytophthora megakarya TaxID=4795 RepID=A0A225VEV7_9STRA|nr:reverse transcriptase [Phytophthora megakarya]
MWGVGVATIVTVIWRWNVDRRHPDGRRQQSLQEARHRARGAIVQVYERYRLGLLPITTSTENRLRVAGAIVSHCRETERLLDAEEKIRYTRVGFFDRGSHGNPVPGGSGSVIVQTMIDGVGMTPVWAAATALGSKRMTNNVAEFVAYTGFWFLRQPEDGETCT